MGTASAANYMYEKATIKGVGYKNVETIIQTQTGLAGNKLVEKESGSGNVIIEKTEIEASRDYDTSDDLGKTGPDETIKDDGDTFFAPPPINNGGTFDPANPDWTQVHDGYQPGDWGYISQNNYPTWPTPGDATPSAVVIKPGEFDPALANCCPDYINFTKEAEFEYMPVSYQTGTYDQKWIEKLCVQNYYIGAVVVEMYTHAEHLQKNTEVKTRRVCCDLDDIPDCGCCDGSLEANFNSNVIGVAHIGWLSKDVTTNSKGRHDEYGRSVEDLTGVFSIEKFIQLWGNETCGAVQVDWLPCI